MNRFHGGFSKRILTCFTFGVNPLEAILNNQMMKKQKDRLIFYLGAKEAPLKNKRGFLLTFLFVMD
jgi:hypothetical protein